MPPNNGTPPILGYHDVSGLLVVVTMIPKWLVYTPAPLIALPNVYVYIMMHPHSTIPCVSFKTPTLTVCLLVVLVGYQTTTILNQQTRCRKPCTQNQDRRDLQHKQPRQRPHGICT